MGRHATRVGHDLNYLAASGVLHLTGAPGGPPAIPGVPFADGLAGLSAALNVVAALWRRVQTGTGCYLDIAIADGPAFLMAMEYDYFWNTGRQRQRGDTHLCGGYPWYHVFETADGRYLSVAAVEPQFYARLCHVLGRPDLASRQFVDGAERQALFECFAGIFRSKTCDEWMEVLGSEDVCVAPVLTPGEAAQTVQMKPSAAGQPTELRWFARRFAWRSQRPRYQGEPLRHLRVSGSLRRRSEACRSKEASPAERGSRDWWSTIRWRTWAAARGVASAARWLREYRTGRRSRSPRHRPDRR